MYGISLSNRNWQAVLTCKWHGRPCATSNICGIRHPTIIPPKASTNVEKIPVFLASSQTTLYRGKIEKRLPDHSDRPPKSELDDSRNEANHYVFGMTDSYHSNFFAARDDMPKSS